jgi:hypothetical protein
MSTLHPDLEAELEKPALRMFGALEIIGPDYELRLVDGSGFITMDGHTFVGRDDTFGTLAGLTDYSDGLDDEAPSLTLTFHTATNAAMAALAAPEAQGSQVALWVGAVDSVTGQVIGDADLCFIGETDVPTQNVGLQTRSLDLTVISTFDRLLDVDEGIAMYSGFHQTMYPGELGFEFTSQVREPPNWGSNAPKRGLTTGVNNAGGGSYTGPLGVTLYF